MFVAPLGKSGTQTTPGVDAVTITGATISSVGVGLVVARLMIVNDGELWQYVRQTGYGQLSDSTDWLRPILEQIDPTYEMRYINHTGDALEQFGPESVEGTWVDMSVSRDLFFFTANDQIPLACTFDLQIRKDGGAVLATGSFVLDATRILQ